MEWSKTHFFSLSNVDSNKVKPIILQDANRMVKIPVPVGKVVRAKGYHPQSSSFKWSPKKKVISFGHDPYGKFQFR